MDVLRNMKKNSIFLETKHGTWQARGFEVTEVAATGHVRSKCAMEQCQDKCFYTKVSIKRG